jgi:hypothetical protein
MFGREQKVLPRKTLGASVKARAFMPALSSPMLSYDMIVPWSGEADGGARNPRVCIHVYLQKKRRVGRYLTPFGLLLAQVPDPNTC